MPYALYLLCGWGIPFAVVMSWTIVHQQQSVDNPRTSSFCWLPYAKGPHLWILAGTMGFILILNVLLLLAIVVILVQKLRSENSAESKKIWRTVKATILLVPLLGVSNIPLFYEPPQPSSIYMLGSAILQHSQGIFIAVLYCFLNTEIQNAVKRQLSKVQSLQSFGFVNRSRCFETERTYLAANDEQPAPRARFGTKDEFSNKQPHNGRAHSYSFREQKPTVEIEIIPLTGIGPEKSADKLHTATTNLTDSHKVYHQENGRLIENESNNNNGQNGSHTKICV